MLKAALYEAEAEAEAELVLVKRAREAGPLEHPR
jgi:hypothetical protein